MVFFHDPSDFFDVHSNTAMKKPHSESCENTAYQLAVNNQKLDNLNRAVDLNNFYLEQQTFLQAYQTSIMRVSYRER